MSVQYSKSQIEISFNDAAINPQQIRPLASGFDTISAAELGEWDITNISGSISLPTGAATSASQLIQNISLASIDSKLTNLSVGQSGSWTVLQGSPPWLISLPIGASSATKQDTGNTSLSSIDTKLSTTANGLKVDNSGVTQPVSGIFWQATQPVSGTVAVSNFPGTQTVSGTVGINNFPATQPVSIASMPSTPVTGTFFQATQPVSGTFFQATQPVSIASMPSTPVTGTFWQATQPISAASLPLPSGAATSALQSSLSAQLPSALGAKTIANSMAINIASDQTVPVSGTFFQSTQPVSIASMPSTPVTGTFFQATQPVSIASMPSTPVTGTFWQATQPISGTVTANVGTTNGLALDATLSTIDTDIKAAQPRKLQDGAGNAVTSQVNGSQRALDIGVNVAGVQVDPRSIRALTSSDVVSAAQSGTWNITNVSGTISLPTGASTSASQTTGNNSLSSIDTKLTSQATAVKQDTGNTSLSSIDSKLGTLGQKVATGSTPVVLASDQTSIPVTQSGTWNVTSVINTLTLPTGASTSANQATEIASLSSIDTKLSSQATSAKQDTGNTSLSSIDTKLTSQATSAKQDTGNTSLSSIDTKLTGPLPVSQSGTWAVGISGAVSLASNASQETAGNLDKLTSIMENVLSELKSMRLALTAIACSGNQNEPEDFNPETTNYNGRLN